MAHTFHSCCSLDFLESLTNRPCVLLILILEYISPSVMVPENRLETMLKQAIEMQVVNCFYHDNRNTSSTLYSDHICQKYVHPVQAQSSFFMMVVVSTLMLTMDLILIPLHRSGIPTVSRRVLESHTNEVWYISFSHNGKYLASASADRRVIIWNLEVCEQNKDVAFFIHDKRQ